MGMRHNQHKQTGLKITMKNSQQSSTWPEVNAHSLALAQDLKYNSQDPIPIPILSMKDQTMNTGHEDDKVKQKLWQRFLA